MHVFSSQRGELILHRATVWWRWTKLDDVIILMCTLPPRPIYIIHRYVDVLKLLIVAIKSGYEMGVAPLDLIQRVDAVERKAAGRDLLAEELRLRNTWIQVVYAVLSHAGYESVNEGVHETIDDSVAALYKSKIPALMTRKTSGEPFNTDGLVDGNSVIGDPTASIIMTQSLRVIWFTLVVLEEEERCNAEFARQDAPMRPPIPGAF
jgi:hypothetical protein